MEILLSGLIGAFIATILNIAYNYITEQTRDRKNAMMETIAWADDAYERLQMLIVSKDRMYEGKEPNVTDEEYKIITREVKTLLLSSKVVALVALAYGEGSEVQKINALNGEMLKVARKLLKANKDNWSDSKKGIDQHFNNVIDPVRDSILKRFLHGTSVKSVSIDFLIGNLPTLHKMLVLAKKRKSYPG